MLTYNVNMPCWHGMWTCNVNIPIGIQCKQTMYRYKGHITQLTLYHNIWCEHCMSTWEVYMACWHSMSTCHLKMVCWHIMLISSVDIHYLYTMLTYNGDMWWKHVMNIQMFKCDVENAMWTYHVGIDTRIR